MKVLLLEDQPEVGQLIFTFLQKWNMDALYVQSAEEAWETLQDGGFDLFITDLSMPGMSGEEMLVELRAIDSDMPVVIFTGHLVEEEDFAGVQGVLQKPFSLEGVLEKALAVMDDRGRA